MGDVTERNPIPPDLRYPPQLPKQAPMNLETDRTVMRPRPLGTPSPDEPPQRKSNVIPFLRPNQPAAQPFTAKNPPPTAHQITRAMPVPTAVVAAVAPPAPAKPAPTLLPATTAAGHAPAPQVQLHPKAMAAATPVFSAPLTMAMPMLAPLPPAAPVFTPTPGPAHAPAAPWAAYEKLGLGQAALAKVHQKTSKLVVSTYRALGFFILTLIVLLLIGYITESIFYFISDSWVQPMVVTKGDDKIVTLSSQLAEQQNQRDRIASDLSQAEQAIARQVEFQVQFMATVKADLAGRKLVLGKLRGIAGQYASAGAAVTGTNSTYAASERARMRQEFAAGLIDRRAMMAGNYQGAQITTSSLGIAEKRVETEAHADELEMQVSSLEAILADKSASGVLSYEILKIKQEYDNSMLEMNKAIANRDALRSSLARQDEIVRGLAGSSYLRALKDNASVAFVPYGNMKGVKDGVTLYGCTLGMVVCHKVGTVIQVLPGEIQQKHPHRDKMLRGQLVEIQIEDTAAAEDDVLFVGGKPMGV